MSKLSLSSIALDEQFAAKVDVILVDTREGFVNLLVFHYYMVQIVCCSV
jgi:hypothetical protein